MKKLSEMTRKQISVYIASFALICAVTVALFWKYGYAPFGDNSLSCMDANVQYLDFFSYFKDVLAGENSIAYTMGKTLGGTNIAVFSYYLSSPFTLLVGLFDKSELALCFNIMVLLKLATCAVTMVHFLQGRFHHQLQPVMVVLMSISYALMQYNIAQSSNIMWLDGVSMLHLMLLGVYRVIERRSSKLLIFSTGLAILFNWYTAGINCLFTIIWFVLEWLLALSRDFGNVKQSIFDTFKTLRCYITSMLLGVCLSAFLFFPTLASLATGGRGDLDLSLFSNEFTGNILNIIQGFTEGSLSSDGQCSLYCGSLVLLGCISFFACKQIEFIRKIKVGIILFTSGMIFYWKPLYTIFSLFRDVGSYWYRCSYVTIFLLIFIAASFYTEVRFVSQHDLLSFLLKCALGYSALLLFLTYVTGEGEIKKVYYSCAFIILLASAAAFYYKHISDKKQSLKAITSILLIGIITLELAYNTKVLMKSSHAANYTAYQTYSLNQQEQIDSLQAYDSGMYRILQTSTYRMKSATNLTSNYNEALAYDYWSIAGYTSDSDNLQLDFLNKLGYRMNGDAYCIVNNAIIPSVSLLGVKYILSEYAINGLELVEELGESNGKAVYYNPYTLPMAFVYQEYSELSDTDTGDLNPFEYQNLLYSQLLGEEVVLYIPLTVSEEDADNVRIYTIELPEGSYAVYGNIVWSSYMNAYLAINNSLYIGYSRWTSPSVF